MPESHTRKISNFCGAGQELAWRGSDRTGHSRASAAWPVPEKSVVPRKTSLELHRQNRDVFRGVGERQRLPTPRVAPFVGRPPARGTRALRIQFRVVVAATPTLDPTARCTRAG